MSDTPLPPELNGLDPGELLVRALNTVQPTTGTGRWEPPTPEELARLLPQYRVESLLGRGGMGAVYKAIQPALDRPVAIKLLSSEMSAQEQFVLRFQREARTLAKLHHPGIVTIYDSGRTSDGHLFFVMEYVEGTDLRRVLRGPGLNPDQALELTGQICDALQAAHKRGVIHRDIKPENILISSEGHAKLADFGLSRPMSEDTCGLTCTNMVMGTPDYMSPEQRTGDADERTDVFALGVVLYEMLTGRPPHGAFDPPSRKVQIDVRLDEVVIKALQEEPDRRYQHVSEMKTAVDHIRTTPMPNITPPVARKSSRRNIAMVAAAIVVLLGVAGLYLWLNGGTRGAERSQASTVAANVTLSRPSATPVPVIENTASIKSLEQALITHTWQWYAWVSWGGAKCGLQDSNVHFLSDGTVRIPKWGTCYRWTVTGPKTFTLELVENDSRKMDDKANTSSFTFDEAFSRFEGNDPWLPHRDILFVGIRSAPVNPQISKAEKTVATLPSPSASPVEAANGENTSPSTLFKFNYIKEKSAKMEPKGYRKGSNPVMETDNPNDVFLGKPVYFDLHTGNKVHFAVDSATPLTKLVYTGVAFKGFTIEVLDRNGLVLASGGPYNYGNVRKTLEVLLPDISHFEVVITDNSGEWLLVKEMRFWAGSVGQAQVLGESAASQQASAASPVQAEVRTTAPARSETSLLETLSHQAPNASTWVLAPLDETVPGNIRQNITMLREDLIDEAKSNPKASLDAYNLGYQLCNVLIAALDERDATLVRAGYRAAQANANTRVTSQALEARRNYMMSWPQYAREKDQAGEIFRQQMNNANLTKELPKVEWSNRTAVLRRTLDGLYAKYREALRKGVK